MPAMATSSSRPPRSSLTMRSVPMLPEPMIAALVMVISLLPGECRADPAEAGDPSFEDVARRDRHHRAERTRQPDVTRTQGERKSAGRASSVSGSVVIGGHRQAKKTN